MVERDKVEAGVRLILEGIGEDVTREGLLETPERIARMCGFGRFRTVVQTVSCK